MGRPEHPADQYDEHAPTPIGETIAEMATGHTLTRDGTCAICRKPIAQTFTFGAWVPSEHAECEAQRDAQEREAQQSAAHRARTEKLMAQLAPPRQYATATIDAFDPTVIGTADAGVRKLLESKKRGAQAFVEKWPTRFDNARFPQVLIMQGAPGTGKTMLTWAIALAVTQRYAATVVVATLADIIRDVRESWRKTADGPSERARLRRYRDADLLCIDEVSRHALYGEPSQAMYDLIAPREADFMPTIITTNEVGGAIEDVIGPALASRAAGAGSAWDFGALDYRIVRAHDRAGTR